MEKTNIYKKLFEVKKAWITLQRNTKAFNYKYATLDQIQAKLNPSLQDNKLIVLHYITNWKVVTQIRDIESESYVSSEIELTTTKAQDKWSEITYFRRYNLLSLLDLEVSDDDWKKAQDSKPKLKTMAKEDYARFQEWLNAWKFDKISIDKVIANTKAVYNISTYEQTMVEELTARKLIV
jgi:hypothetical protein